MTDIDMSAVRTTSRLVLALFGAALLLLVAAPSANAQDPYGSTTTTKPSVRSVEASCSLSLKEGRPGDTVTATVNGVFLGENVRLLFDGVQVAATTAPTTLTGTSHPLAATAVGSPVIFNGGTQQQIQTTSVSLTFKVPNAQPGTHVVTAVGDTFSCFCNPNGEFLVLAPKSSRSLPRTGIYVALYLVVAAILLGIGSELVLRARRRRARILAAYAAEEPPAYTGSSRY